MKTPLLPLPCPSPFTSAGVAHSMCNWQSPKPCLVEIPPVPLTVTTPSLTTHFAGPPSLSLFHWERSSPSNRTIASEGGGSGSTTRGSSLGGGISPSSAARPAAGARVRKVRHTKDGKQQNALNRN